jgi:hypothetical protein
VREAQHCGQDVPESVQDRGEALMSEADPLSNRFKLDAERLAFTAGELLDVMQEFKDKGAGRRAPKQ